MKNHIVSIYTTSFITAGKEKYRKNVELKWITFWAITCDNIEFKLHFTRSNRNSGNNSVRVNKITHELYIYTRLWIILAVCTFKSVKYCASVSSKFQFFCVIKSGDLLFVRNTMFLVGFPGGTTDDCIFTFRITHFLDTLQILEYVFVTFNLSKYKGTKTKPQNPFVAKSSEYVQCKTFFKIKCRTWMIHRTRLIHKKSDKHFNSISHILNGRNKFNIDMNSVSRFNWNILQILKFGYHLSVR